MVLSSVKSADLPALTVRQMAEVDRMMIEVYHIGLIRMMENAGLHLAALACHLFGNKNLSPFSVRVLPVLYQKSSGLDCGGLFTQSPIVQILR